MPPPSSEAARASLCQCFQMAFAAPGPMPAPSLQLKERSEEPTQYSLADLFAGINPPPPEILKESCPMSQSSRGRMATRLKPPRANHSPEKRRSSSRPKGEADLKCGRSGGAKPSWNLSHIRGRHSHKAPSEPAKQPEGPEATTKLKLVVKKVCLDKATPVNLENLGPAARSKYNTTGHSRTRQGQVPTPYRILQPF